MHIVSENIYKGNLISSQQFDIDNSTNQIGIENYFKNKENPGGYPIIEKIICWIFELETPKKYLINIRSFLSSTRTRFLYYEEVVSLRENSPRYKDDNLLLIPNYLISGELPVMVFKKNIISICLLKNIEDAPISIILTDNNKARPS
jgi:hypothetical protein